ncbi:hypothetical protein STEG23_008216, partial [Scotinomys teguina]
MLDHMTINSTRNFSSSLFYPQNTVQYQNKRSSMLEAEKPALTHSPSDLILDASYSGT